VPQQPADPTEPAVPHRRSWPLEPAPLVIDGVEINRWDRQVLLEARAGGVSTLHATCAVWEDARETLRALGAWRRRFADHGDLITPVRGTDDIERAHAQGRTGVMLGFQNTSPFEDDIELVETFHRLDVRCAQLTYNVQNLVGGSCFEPSDSGLSRFGEAIVAEMNRVGMLVDCSHVGEWTTRDAIEASRDPIALTHANPRWFCDSPRNKSSETLKALAARGGVIGCTLYPLFIGGTDTPREAFCQMIADLVEEIGLDHVAIGTDLTRGQPDADLGWLRDGRWRRPDPEQRLSWPEWPAWFRSAADFPALAEGLLEVGLDEAAIRKVLGENWLRLLGQVVGP